MKKHAPKFLLFLVILALAGCAISILPQSAHAEGIPLDLSKVTKADIIATVEHLQRNEKAAEVKLAQAQGEIVSAQNETKAVQLAADNLQKERDSWKADDAKQSALAIKKSVEAHENAKERDVLVYLFAIISGFWLLSQYESFQIPIFPPWKYIIEAGVFALGFGCAYALGRFALSWLAHFIP